MKDYSYYTDFAVTFVKIIMVIFQAPWGSRANFRKGNKCIFHWGRRNVSKAVSYLEARCKQAIYDHES